jgi:hypothetical protein
MRQTRKARWIFNQALWLAVLTISLLAFNSFPVAAANYITVMFTIPAANTDNLGVRSHIMVSFNSDVDQSSINALSFRVNGSLTGRVDGVYQVDHTIVTFIPNSDYKPGETLVVTLSTSIQGTNGYSLSPGKTFEYLVTVQDGTSAFSSTGVGFGTGSDNTIPIAVGDVDNDGYVDLVVGNWLGQDAVYLNDGDGTFDTLQHPFGSSSARTHSIALGDINFDGWLDICVSNFDDSLVFLNDGDGTFDDVSYSFTSGEGSGTVAIGDLNNDGAVDFVVGRSGQDKAIFTDGAGNILNSVNIGPANSTTYCVALGDMNGDGYLDIVVGNWLQQSTVYLNDGDSTFDTFSYNFTSADQQIHYLTLADMDADRNLDIVTANVDGQNAVYYNDGDGTFDTRQANFGTGIDNTFAVAAGDINNDGYTDIAVGNGGAQNVVYLNDGDGTFDANHIDFGPGNDATYSLALADLNGDGSLDIAVGNWASQNAVYYNSGPVMQITGKTVVIRVGDNSPDVNDDTSFGSASVNNGTVDHTFTIKNTGATQLTLTSGVSLSGTNSGDFKVTSQPDATVDSGRSTNFTIRFDPSGEGSRTATVTIVNNAGGDFTFGIQGNGTTEGSGNTKVGGSFTPVNRLFLIIPLLGLASAVISGGVLLHRKRR